MKKKHTATIAVAIAAGSLIAAAAGLSALSMLDSQAKHPAAARKKQPARESPERETVRAYLRKNTPTGKWEEIEWFHVIPIDSITAIRLKYRTENPIGGMSVVDEVFVLNRDGTIQYTEPNGDRRIWWK